VAKPPPAALPGEAPSVAPQGATVRNWSRRDRGARRLPRFAKAGGRVGVEVTGNAVREDDDCCQLTRFWCADRTEWMKGDRVRDAFPADRAESGDGSSGAPAVEAFRTSEKRPGVKLLAGFREARRLTNQAAPTSDERDTRTER